MPATKERTYNDTEIAERLKELPGWYYEDGWIRRVYKTDGWPTTLMLVNAVGYLAEAAYHHPDLSVTWGRVIVKLQNHAAGGIRTRISSWPGRSRRSSSGSRRAAHSRAPRTSGFGRGIRGRRGRGAAGRTGTVDSGERRQLPTDRSRPPPLVPAAPPRALRHRQARGASTAAGAEGDAAAVPAGRRGHEDHRGRLDDHSLDRPLSGGSARDRSGADSRPLRRGYRGVAGAIRGPSREGTQGPPGDPSLLRASGCRSGLRLLFDRDPGRDQQRAQADPGGDSGRAPTISAPAARISSTSAVPRGCPSPTWGRWCVSCARPGCG